MSPYEPGVQQGEYYGDKEKQLSFQASGSWKEQSGLIQVYHTEDLIPRYVRQIAFWSQARPGSMTSVQL